MGHKREYRTFDQELERSLDFSLGPTTLSGIRHELIDRAIGRGDHDMWYRLGLALIEACDINDLSSNVSDRFVSGCPDEVFRRFGTDASPYHRFRNWRKKADQLRFRR